MDIGSFYFLSDEYYDRFLNCGLMGKSSGWKYISRGPSGAHIGADISEKEDNG